jgi:hypothetical protein
VGKINIPKEYARDWQSAARYIVFLKVMSENKGQSIDQAWVDSCEKNLKQANSNAETPRDADDRWWGRLRSGREFNLAECTKPVESQSSQQPNPAAQTKPETKPEIKPDASPQIPVIPPEVKEQPVSEETKSKINQAVKRADGIGKILRELNLDQEAAKLQAARNEALTSASGKSEEKAKKALSGLSVLLKQCQQRIKEVREEYGK